MHTEALRTRIGDPWSKQLFYKHQSLHVPLNDLITAPFGLSEAKRISTNTVRLLLCDTSADHTGALWSHTNTHITNTHITNTHITNTHPGQASCLLFALVCDFLSVSFVCSCLCIRVHTGVCVCVCVCVCVWTAGLWRLQCPIKTFSPAASVVSAHTCCSGVSLSVLLPATSCQLADFDPNQRPHSESLHDEGCPAPSPLFILMWHLTGTSVVCFV